MSFNINVGGNVYMLKLVETYRHKFINEYVLLDDDYKSSSLLKRLFIFEIVFDICVCFIVFYVIKSIRKRNSVISYGE